MGKIDSKDISVVVQGAIDKENTPKCLASIRKHLPDAEIILSTWEGSDVEGLDYDKVLLNEDPLGFKMSDTGEINNVKRQICSTLNGVKLSNRNYVLKIRSDLQLNSNNFLNYFNKYDKYNENWRILKSRVLISSIATRDPREWECPFCASDWIHFGLREDLYNLWNIDYPTEEEENWFNIHPRDLVVIFKYPALIAKFNPEQFILTKFAQKNGVKISARHMFDNNKEAQVETLNLIANNFTVLSPKMFSFEFLKKSGRKADRWRLMTHVKWLKIYNEFANGDAKIPLVDFEKISYYRNNKRRSDRRLVRQLELHYGKKEAPKAMKNPPWEQVDEVNKDEVMMSVVVPCHGRVDLLTQTLESLALQTSRNFEVIITDDSKTELERIEVKEAAEKILGAKEIPFKYIFSAPCIGQVLNTNQGLKNAKGKYVRILHSDDILHPQTIKYEIDSFEAGEGEVACLYHKNIKFFEGMPFFSTYRVKKCVETYSILVKNWLHSGTAVPSGFVYPREILEKIGLMNPEYKRACDWEFFYRFVKYAHENDLKVVKIPPKFLGYRSHADNNTNNSKLAFINFFEYRKIADLIAEDMLSFGYSEHDVYVFKRKAAKYRYNRLLSEIKLSDPENLESHKELIWNAFSDPSDMECVV